MTPFYTVNGVNMIPFLAENGLSWSEEDIDAENSGRTMDGKMHRAIVAKKDKHVLTFRELPLEDVRTVTNAFNDAFVTISTNIHPKIAGVVSLTMYNSSRKAAVWYLNEGDEEDAKWMLDSIALIER